MMKERPILMTPENAQKCHDGTKTQTRRLNGLRKINEGPGSWACTFLDSVQAFVFGRQPAGTRGHRQIQCPYGVVGDRLWVREAFTYWECQEEEPKRGRRVKHVRWEDLSPQKQKELIDGLSHAGEDFLVYKGGGDKRSLGEWVFPHPIYDHCIGKFDKTIPSIHMPRWACRTVLEITEVRVERLQEITEEDAKAEGCKPHPPSGLDGRVYRRPFECLWESINGKGSWDLNPWVWVIAFKKVRAE